MPAYLVPHLSGAWKAVDAIEHPIPWAHTVDVTARPSLNVRRAPTTAAAKVASLPYGRDVATTRLEKYGGKYAVNGAVRCASPHAWKMRMASWSKVSARGLS